jgi:hypothetical protein
MFIIEQAPENVRNDNKQRENKTLHVKVRGDGDQGGGGDDPRLGEPAGQKVHQRMLNGTAQDDLLQNAEDRVGKGDRQAKQKWIATKEWKGEHRRRSKFSEGEHPFYDRHGDNEDPRLEQCVGASS